MDEPVFIAVAVGDGLLVRALDVFVASALPLLAELIDLLDDDVVPRERGRWFRRAPTAEAVKRRMFPDAAASTAEADAFWERHRDVLTDSGPAWRVRQRCAEPLPWLIGFDEVDDWLVAFGQLRGLHRTWTRATLAGSVSFSAVQEALVAALEPRAVTGWQL